MNKILKLIIGTFAIFALLVSDIFIFYKFWIFLVDYSSVKINDLLIIYILVFYCVVSCFMALIIFIICLNLNKKDVGISNLANKMFKNSVPMDGKELKILRKTASRLISKEPTNLNKK